MSCKMVNIPSQWTLTPEDESSIFNTQITPAEVEPCLAHHHQSDGKQPWPSSSSSARPARARRASRRGSSPPSS
ncbi:hypothetical protein P8C59_008581 [Phyllachora maydis]|uniref:Uncharacterized protein n=1 Tax=Phyllachora maydis TaxID=1825666 RepID=A0AAD9MIL6_9PEZI|nr:hypothetical protein P8C59_008581 [Phyllachora maydis]